MRGKEFEEEDTQVRPVTAGQTVGEAGADGDLVYEIEWAEDEQVGGEMVLRVTPITGFGRAKPPTP